MDHFGDRIILFLTTFSPLIDRYMFSSDLFAEVVELPLYFGILLQMCNEDSMYRWAESALDTQFGNWMILSLCQLQVGILEAVGVGKCLTPQTLKQYYFFHEWYLLCMSIQ